MQSIVPGNDERSRHSTGDVGRSRTVFMRVIPECSCGMIGGDFKSVFLGQSGLQFKQDIVAFKLRCATGIRFRLHMQTVRMQVGCVPIMMAIGDVPACGLRREVVDKSYPECLARSEER